MTFVPRKHEMYMLTNFGDEKFNNFCKFFLESEKILNEKLILINEIRQIPIIKFYKKNDHYLGLISEYFSLYEKVCVSFPNLDMVTSGGSQHEKMDKLTECILSFRKLIIETRDFSFFIFKELLKSRNKEFEKIKNFFIEFFNRMITSCEDYYYHSMRLESTIFRSRAQNKLGTNLLKSLKFSQTLFLENKSLKETTGRELICKTYDF